MNARRGTYVGMLGPSFETDAEVKALGILGADYVGCSTVCEAIMARALKMQVLGLTLVTNKAGAAVIAMRRNSLLVTRRPMTPRAYYWAFCAGSVVSRRKARAQKCGLKKKTSAHLARRLFCT